MPHDLTPEMHAALSDPEVRGSVTAAVRRRVPSDDVPDVAQAVFCEALESKTGPGAPGEIPYWLAGVARHTAADYFRKRPRERPALEGEGGEEILVLPPRFEVREAIARVLSTLGEGAKKTLLWMVLEQEGVLLQTIAHDERMTPAAVRARVYRLRRTLRKELAYLLCALLILAGVAAALRPYLREPPRAVAPRLTVPSGLPSAAPKEDVGVHVDPPAPRRPPSPLLPPASATPPAPPVPSSAAPVPVPSATLPAPRVRSAVPRSTFERPSKPQASPSASPAGASSL